MTETKRNNNADIIPDRNPAADDEFFMGIALKLAAEAARLDEVPVGAVAVRNGAVIAKAFNTRETARQAIRHAEISAIEEACRTLGGWRLPGVTLYVTMEPCLMCAGAIVNARVERVVYGAKDLRFGACGSLIDVREIPLNHRPEIVGGVRGEECRALLQAYFREKREAARSGKSAVFPTDEIPPQETDDIPPQKNDEISPQKKDET